jgi:hypothetical protein
VLLAQGRAGATEVTRTPRQQSGGTVAGTVEIGAQKFRINIDILLEWGIRSWASLIRFENRLALIYSCSQVIAKLTGNAWGTGAIRRMNSIKTAG